MIKIEKNVRNAILIGVMCSISYLAIYVARNVLGAVSPQMIEEGVFTTENIGTLSSLYFITYAFGQLINGAIGDHIHAKYMISLGLAMAGTGGIIFTGVSRHIGAAYAAYACIGFFLSMIYGPMSKVVAENVELVYAVRCTLGYTFASFLGSPIAGLIAMILVWRDVFITSSTFLLVMSAVCFATFTLFEKKGIVRYGQYQREKKTGSGIKVLIKNHIIKFSLICMITGIVRTTVIFWLPTYLSQYFGFSSERAAFIFTIATFVISGSTFGAIFIYERLKRNMNLTMLLSFLFAAVDFILVFFLRQPTLNIVFFILAVFGSNCAASMVLSRYCAGLRDTGMVSLVTGFLDFLSYMAASISSVLFANSVSQIGWSGLILVWASLMGLGVLLCLPYGKFIRKYR